MVLRIFPFRGPRWHSFTLIELLVVILIIAILAALTLSAGEAVMNRAARSRASAEIQAMSAALESYKADNGIYPWTNSSQTSFGSTNDYASSDASTLGGFYQVSSQILYENLSGKTNFLDTPVAGVKAYSAFKANQVGNVTAAANSAYSSSGSTYVQDPFGYAYGYYAPAGSTTTAPPNNGATMFDMWSTGGLLETTASSTPGWTNTWISNWTPQ
jgi:prepilin-type N-terminal cleavage/methylation domain-containing protein